MGFRVPRESMLFFVTIFAVLFVQPNCYGKKMYSVGSPGQEYFSTSDSLNVLPNFSRLSLAADEKPTSISTAPRGNPFGPGSLPQYSIDKQEIENLLSSARPLDEFTEVLTPAIFAQPDVFHYFMQKIIKIEYADIRTLITQVSNVLKHKRFPESNIPYAEALLSLLTCWYDFARVRQALDAIRIRRIHNTPGYDTLPDDVSVPPELNDMFSADIFSDPNPSMRIFVVLLTMPKDTMDKVKLQLRSFVPKLVTTRVQNIPFPSWYVWYTKALFEFLQGAALDNLKRDLSKVQRVVDRNQEQ